MDNWANSDPLAAAQWAATLPDGKMRGEAWDHLLSRWENEDAPAAANWLNVQPACEARDAGIARVLQNAAADLEPKDAVRLARSIGDPEQRGDALVSVAQSWLKLDSAAATAWINRAKDLTPEQRDSLLAPPDEALPVTREVITP